MHVHSGGICEGTQFVNQVAVKYAIKSSAVRRVCERSQRRHAASTGGVRRPSEVIRDAIGVQADLASEVIRDAIGVQSNLASEVIRDAIGVQSDLASEVIRDAIGVQSDLATRRDEDEHRLCRRVIEDRAVRWLVHGGHAGAVMLAREARDVHLERHRAYLIREGARA